MDIEAGRGEVGSFARALDEKTRAFSKRFMLITCGALTVGATLVLITYLAIQPEPMTLVSLALLLLATGGGFALTLLDRSREAPWALLFGVSAAACLGLVWSGGGTFATGAILVVMIAVVIAPFLVSVRVLVMLVAIDVQMVIGAYLKMGLVDGMGAPDVVPPAVGTSLVLIASAGSISAFVRHAKQNQDQLRQRLRDIDVVMDRARRIATGDLSGQVARDGDVAEVIADMLEGLRGVVEQIQQNAQRVASASSEIAAMAQQQERSAVEQGGAIEETRRTVASLLEASGQISQAARGVAENATGTLQNAQVIADRIHALTEQTQRISDILEIIKDVANKSELLALNAALEGAKAGEAGRGFSLVASQMQRLAESVMESVKGVKKLTADIRAATSATALATEDATKIAGDTADAAQRIRVIIEQQNGSTQQVTRAMDDIAEATHQAAAGTNQTLQAVRELSLVAERLNETAARFRL
jgi:methyl-accepting chemotaxis protein